MRAMRRLGREHRRGRVRRVREAPAAEPVRRRGQMPRLLRPGPAGGGGLMPAGRVNLENPEEVKGFLLAASQNAQRAVSACVTRFAKASNGDDALVGELFQLLQIVAETQSVLMGGICALLQAQQQLVKPASVVIPPFVG